ncbi:protein sprouty-like [Schistocerca gregaria]|uniref:protein sprouty-like n=1 Tax=Schistocerca gregaria TaxID=7010 RepID=UPI00211F21E2|nr:protein sprouty-like [Schistocerca gregaria]XP_049862974.1 protein sprouty-like [Schistocerca gregaria]XP_049862975.1 protein sprouty-like [Schistocerca gregaria]XP_049862976.1 protein sprouty-like [Schistocerca gregaria]XP_049862977.1 protein sprouty-like [Schistocerca gregaria]
MAQHGSSPPELQRPPAAPALALVHRPRVPRPPPTTPAATAAAPATTGAVVAGDVVTLTTPRPDTERVTNEYVETPFRPATAAAPLPAAGKLAAAPKQRHHPLSLQLPPARDSARDHQALHLPVVVAPGKRPQLPPAPHHHAHLLHHHHHHHHHHAHTFEKEGRGYPGPAAALSGGGAGSPASGSASGSSSPGGRGSDGRVVAAPGSLGPAGGVPDCFRGSIICPECGRCRCESCRKPRPLPSRWLCDNSCYCSAETALDYATCLCCVKGLFYHCCRDHDLEGADEPCACGPPRCAARWGCLCALSLALPCLWWYWPLRACLRLCEACYRRHSAAGCRCRPASSLLLAASPDF